MLTTTMKRIAYVIMLLAICIVSGCIDEKRNITLNPDGSGKMIYEVTFKPSGFSFDGKEPDPKKEMQEEVLKIIEDSMGIATWKDISFKLTDEGKIHFTGTAYFRNIAKVEIKPGGFSSSSKTVFSKGPSGKAVIEIKQKIKKSSEEKKEYTETELVEEIKKAKQKYSKSRLMISGMVNDLKTETVLHLPGRIVEISNFAKIDDTTANLKFEGIKMLEGMDAMMQDDEYLKEQIKAGRNPVQDGPEDELKANEIYFGQYAPVRIVFESNSNEQFDYKTEVAAAKKNFKNMLKESGVSAKTATLIAQGADVVLSPGDVIIAGVRLIRYSDSKRGIRPFNHDKEYGLNIVLELPDESYFISDGIINSAVTDTGQDILPEKEYDQKIHWVRKSKDNKAARFDIKLLLPDDEAKSLAELTGTLNATKSTGTKSIVLENVDFTKDEKYTIDGFTISPTKTKPGEWEKDNEYVTINPKLSAKEYIGTNFYDDAGAKLDVKGAGTSASNGKYTSMDFRFKGEFPDKGKIVFEVRDNMTEHKIPFKISNVSLTGVPLK